MTDPSLVALLERRVSTLQRRVLVAATVASRRHGYNLFLVGGVVRDLLLSGQLRDLDLTVEGDGLELAQQVADELGARLRLHERFLTAEVELKGEHVDVVTARSESYPAPGQLPVIRPGTLHEDLQRRDFAVNAMALQLSPAATEEVIDPFDGRQDLGKRSLRVLHAASFEDDPTRILRGARLGSRLGFEFAPTTSELAAEAIAGGAFDPVSGDRLRRELVTLLEDRAPASSLRLLDDLGFHRVLGRPGPFSERDLEVLDKIVSLRHRLESRWNDVVVEIAWWRAVLLGVCLGDTEQIRAGVAARLGFPAALATLFAEASRRIDRASARLDRQKVAAADLEAALEELSTEEMVVLWVSGTDRVARWIERWFGEWQRLRLDVGGADLIAAGFRPGPQLGRALAATLAARRGGLITRGEELEYAIAVLRSEEGAGSEDD